MLKRTGAGAGAAESDGQIVDRAPTWSSPGKSIHSPLVLYDLCLWYCHLKQRHSATDINTKNSAKCLSKIYNLFRCLKSLGFYTMLRTLTCDNAFMLAVTRTKHTRQHHSPHCLEKQYWHLVGSGSAG